MMRYAYTLLYLPRQLYVFIEIGAVLRLETESSCSRCFQEGWAMHGHHYLFLSEDRGPDSRLGSTPRIESTVYVMGSDGQFVAVQTLPTDGAHAAEHFSAGGQDWLAVANFGGQLPRRLRCQPKLLVC